MTNQPVLVMEGISKQFRSFQLGPLDLRVDTGNVVAVIGNNGSGKSTLFRLIVSLLRADAGEVSLFTANQDEVVQKQKMSYLGGQFDTLKYLPIYKLAAFVARWYPSWNQQTYQSLMVRYQIDEREKYGDCSTGTKKKVEFMIALSCSPKLLLLDEPSTGVDLPSQKKMIEDLMHYMEDEQNSVLIASHNLDELNRLADYIYVLDQGQFIQSFAKDDIQEKWGEVWLDQPLPEEVLTAACIVEQISEKQIVTDNLPQLEAWLDKQEIAITHIRRLNLVEVMTFLIEQKGK